MEEESKTKLQNYLITITNFQIFGPFKIHREKKKRKGNESI